MENVINFFNIFKLKVQENYCNILKARNTSILNASK